MDTVLAVVVAVLVSLFGAAKFFGRGRKKKIVELEDKLDDLDKQAADLNAERDGPALDARREELRAQIDATARADSVDIAIDRVNKWLRSRRDKSSS